MVVAQISDMHVVRAGRRLPHLSDTTVALRRCVARLNALPQTLRPALVLATGDLVDRGDREEYARLRELTEPLTIPLFLLPGNHDDRDAMRAVFSDHAYFPREGPLCYTIEAGSLRIICLDSSEPGQREGSLDAGRLAWLERELSDRTPTLIALHHPPFATGIAGADPAGFRGAEELGDLVARSAHVVRVIAGHVHRDVALGWRGVIGSTAPSTAHQLALTGGPLPVAWTPGGFALHRWDGRRLRTSILPVQRAARRAA